MIGIAFRRLAAGFLLGAATVCIQAQAGTEQPPAGDIDAYRQLINTLEARGGAYAPELAEHLLGLGSALRERQRYAEAASVLRRGVHLARINDGLYSPTQIPLLESEIATHLAAGDFAEADQRRGYLLRIQRRALRGSEHYATALMRHAQWHLEAYRRDIDTLPGWRLDQSYNLYGEAATAIEAREGQDSPALIAPLLGLLKTRYLVTDYDRTVQRKSVQIYDLSSSRAEQEAQRRRAVQQVQARNYTQGLRILERLSALTTPPATETSTALTPGEFLTLVGDWHLYHGRRNAAFDAYRAALTKLAQQTDAQRHRASLFGDPTALPNVDGMQTLPAAATYEQADILLEFSVSNRGRAFDIKRLDENRHFDSAAARLQRKLKKTLFRPRFEEDSPVEAIQVVRAFDVQ